MSHFLPIQVVEATICAISITLGGGLDVTLLNEVDFMIEEYGLRSGCRDYRNLTEVNSGPGSPQYRRLALSHCQAEVSSFLMTQLPA